MTPQPAAGPTLTPRQRAVLHCIRDHVATHGYPPSVREVAAAVGLTSTSSVHHVLTVLERKGHLRRVGRKGVVVEHADPHAELRAVIAAQRAALDQAAGELWCDHASRALGQARVALDAVEKALGGWA